jgi:hypothetical protein
MDGMRLRASCPCEACARLAGIATIRVAEDDRAAMGRRLFERGGIPSGQQVQTPASQPTRWLERRPSVPTAAPYGESLTARSAASLYS